MRPGSVIVDLAAESGGNCELTEPGERDRTHTGVTIVGLTNVAVADGRRREPALRAQRHGAARSTSRPDGELALDFDDEITAGACVAGAPATRRTRHERHLASSIELTMLVLAIFLGFEVISKVPTMLHTPLMSGTNFIHGIVIVGAIIVLGFADDTLHEGRSGSSRWCSRPRTSSAAGSSPTGCSRCSSAARSRAESRVISDPDVVGLLYLVAIVCFILALRFLSSPKHARQGNWVGGVGMVIAIATTLALDGIGNWALIVVGGADRRRSSGVVGARTVKMTAMPQMVALFNGVGGGAAALVALAEFHVSSGDLGGRGDRLDRPLRADRLDLVRRAR